MNMIGALHPKEHRLSRLGVGGINFSVSKARFFSNSRLKASLQVYIYACTLSIFSNNLDIVFGKLFFDVSIFRGVFVFNFQNKDAAHQNTTVLLALSHFCYKVLLSYKPEVYLP